MKINTRQFLGIETKSSSYRDSRVVVVPFPYEEGTSYMKGTAQGPDAIINASYYLELYDEVLNTEPSTAGICTVAPPKIPSEPGDMIETVYNFTSEILRDKKFIIILGGDHSITTGYCQALKEKYGRLSVIQLDAHADLRDSYEGSIYSHACVMSRVREITSNTLQIGIRSMSKSEAERIKNDNLQVCTMKDLRRGTFNIHAALQNLPDPVFITLDVDVFDWSVVRSTGTPEPGGLLWDESMHLLSRIFDTKQVIGFDIVEFLYDKNDSNSPFAVAKVIYKMIGFQYK
jgi:agmatinase